VKPHDDSAPPTFISQGKRNQEEDPFPGKVATLYQLLSYQVESPPQGSGLHFLAVDRRGGMDLRLGVICRERTIKAESVEELSPGEHELDRIVMVTRSAADPGIIRSARAKSILITSYEELLAGLADFTPVVQKQIADYDKSHLAQLYISQAITFEGEGAVTAAEEGTQRFFSDPAQRFLTVLGDFGTGKTALTLKLARDVGLRYLEDPLKSPAPLRIDLKDVGKALGLEDLLVNYLSNVGLNLSFQACLLLIDEGRMLLLFDGFDEMATASSAEITRQNLRELTRTAQGYSKTLLTSRTHYFQDRRETEPLKGPPASTSLSREIERGGFQIAYLQEFNDARIAAYIQKVAPQNSPAQLAALDAMVGLKDLARRPIFLEMVVESLPDLVKRRGAVTGASLYQEYTERWLQR